jgi:phospholipid/cholesterol/gamma-HCH transport system substrate-binding protein
MNDRRMQFAVGVVALGSVFVAVILMMINSPIPAGLSPFGSGTYEIVVRVDKAPGVGEETPVRKNGVLIGRVGSIEDAGDGVIVRVNIDKGRALTTVHKPFVRTTVLGDAVVDFETRPQPGVQPQPLVDGQEVQGEVVANPFEAISNLANLQEDVQKTMVALGDAGNAVTTLANRVNDAFGSGQEEGRVRRFMDTTETAMSQFAQTMSAINQIIGDQPITDGRQPLPGQQPINGPEMRQRLRQGLYDLPSVISSAQTTLNETRTMVESADRNFRNLEGFTKPLGERGPAIAESLVKAVDGLDTLVEDFTVLTQALNSRDGTLGQLIHNPQLYQNLNNLTGNANVVLQYVYELLHKMPQILDNVKVFTDKIAREPGRLIGGALNPNPSFVK